jgi:osmoprotectant transport system substrate-binding protein
MKSAWRACRPLGRILGALALALALVGCQPTIQGPAIIVASADTPEQVLLGQITLEALRSLGYAVEDQTALGNAEIVGKALAVGSVHLWWQYTGDTWTTRLGHDRPVADPQALFRQVREEDALNGISWLAMAPAQHRLGVLMLPARAAELGVGSLSDLASRLQRVDSRVGLCAPRSLYLAPTGVRGLERVYGLRFPEDEMRDLPLHEGYEALGRGECDCALGYADEATLVADGAWLVPDDRGFFLSSNLAVAVRSETLTTYPGIEPPLRQLAALLTQDTLNSLMRQVVVDGHKPGRVARQFVRGAKLTGEQ